MVELHYNLDVGTIVPEMQKNMLEQACLILERAAKEECPVDQGTLRESITHEIDDDIGYVGTNIEYAPYVHQGTGIYAIEGNGRKDVPWVYYSPSLGQFVTTSGIQANPFLQRAADNSHGAIIEKMKEAA